MPAQSNIACRNTKQIELKPYYYHTNQHLPISINEAWDFFSTAKNLTLITPPELDFKILTHLNGHEIYEGMMIDYTVKPLFGIPVTWKTEICSVNKPYKFIDLQVKGPYKLWKHTHSFSETKNGVMMRDEVEYLLPFGWLGQMMHPMLVQKKIDHIFNYRKSVLNKMFNKYASNTN
jgi:ligand-binding SRPBCC domain-containing protein